MAKFEIEIPDGYEVEFRTAVHGEMLLGPHSGVTVCDLDLATSRTRYPVLVLKKVPTYREPTDADRGKPIQVRDFLFQKWTTRYYIGRTRGGRFVTESGNGDLNYWAFAQVEVTEPCA